MRTEDCLSREFQTRPFGRKGVVAAIPAAPRPAIVDDVKLFALTFIGGFLFMTIFLA